MSTSAAIRAWPPAADARVPLNEAVCETGECCNPRRIPMENESAQSHEIRNLPAQPARVETGPLQFGDDWPGVFIRGDRAAALALDLGALIENARHFGTSPLETLALLGAYNVL